MKRNDALAAIDDPKRDWDVIVIGGGATGLGTAVDAAARGFKTLLLEQSDFAKATSSRSTKLIHGGVRYLRQGRISLVRDSLKERGLLLRNAPKLVHHLPFVIPAYHWHEIPYYWTGLKLYDVIAGKGGISPSRRLNRNATLSVLPGLAAKGLKGGIQYYDAQFDDAELALALAETLFQLGGTALNYAPVRELVKEGCRVSGVTTEDLETGRLYTVHSRAVVNATGIFADRIRKLETPEVSPLMTTSRGSHIVLPGSWLPSHTALMVPKTSDGRILFAIPWHGHTLIGTTDVPTTNPCLEPAPTHEEIHYILHHLRQYLERRPSSSDILSCFAGLRPLVKPKGTRSSSAISRDHTIEVSPGGLITITGGKWTTYRKMAADAVDAAIRTVGLEQRPCATEQLTLTPAFTHHETPSPPSSDVPSQSKGASDNAQPLPPPLSEAQVRFAVQHQMARTVDDVLARRLRTLVLDVEAGVNAAPHVAAIMAKELGRDNAWIEAQVESFTRLADSYRPPK